MASISQRNREFWDQLCGTAAAAKLGITGDGIDELRRFDDWYFEYYPYLLRRVPLADLAGKDVLEVGLGYGSLGHRIVASDSRSYVGMDIAAGPVAMIDHRIGLLGATKKASGLQGDLLAAPFGDAVFDAVVSIGTLHHTGDVRRCLDEIHRVLRPGGVAHLMVYNRFSLRQWQRWPQDTRRAAVAQLRRRSAAARGDDAQRAAYDVRLDGTAAPETEFVSIRDLKRMTAGFRRRRFWKENADPVRIRGRRLSRRTALRTVGRVAGLDIYFRIEK